MKNKILLSLGTMFIAIFLIGIVNATINVTLNLPTNLSTEYSPLITTNATGNSTDSYLYNATLYDNSTGVWEARNTTTIGNTSGLVVYYKLNEAAGTIAIDTMNLINGSAVSDMVVNQVGKFGTGWNATSTGDGISVTDNANMEVSTGSITMWIKPDWNILHTSRVIAKGGTTDDASFAFVFQANDGATQTLDWDIREGAAGTLRHLAVAADVQTVLPDNQWSFVALIWNASGMFAFINDSLVASTNIYTGTGFNNTPKDWQFSGWGGTDRELIGTMDEIGFWNVSLSPTQRTTLWNNGLGKEVDKETTATITFNNTYTSGKTILWNYLFCDNNSICNFSSSNKTFYSDIVFTHCNTTYSQNFWNISFKDETSLSYINASIPYSSFNYYVESSSNNHTYTFTETTSNYNYSFCSNAFNSSIVVSPYIQYKNGTGYPQRVYQPSNITLTNITTNTTLYLLSSTDGIYVTFQVINSADQTIEGASVIAIREIGGVNVTVGQGLTGGDGSLTLWLNPDYVHYFNFSKSGFTSYATSFAPTQSGYTITLGGGGVIPISYFKGINFNVTPTNSSLTNDTIYSFGFWLTSSFWSLDEYGFNLRLSNGTIITGGSSAVSGTQLSLNYNTTNQSKVYLDYYWKINGTYTNGTRLWIVYNTDKTQYSIAYFFTDLQNYFDSGFFGLDDFGRYLIIFLVMFITIGIFSYKYGINNQIILLTMMFLVIFFFDVVIGLVPPIYGLNGNEIPYILTFLAGLILVVYALKEGIQ